MIYLRQPLVARGGQRRCCGIDPVVFAGVTDRKHPHPRRELGRHVHHGLSGRRQPHRQPHRQVPTPRPPAFSTAQRRSGNRLAQRWSDLKPERSCGKLARSRSSLVASSTAATATDALWGSTPISTFSCARTSAFRSDLRHHRRERRTFRVRGAHIPLLSHFARRAPAGRKPRTSQPTSRGRQEVRERSLKPVP
jgi:hypothetical protein